MKFENVKGSIVALVTPFCEDGSVNFDALTNLIEWHIAEGTDAILTLGTTGEYPTMTHEEDAAVVEHTIKTVNGRIPVVVGSGSNCTATQVEKSIEYQNMGADALLLISLSLAAAIFPYKQRRGKYSGSAIALIPFTLITFERGIADWAHIGIAATVCLIVLCEWITAQLTTDETENTEEVSEHA